MSTTQANLHEIKNFLVKIDGVDITSMVLQLDIFQELFMPTWSCQISFMDTQNILMNIPVKAGSTVVISMETQYPKNESKIFKFMVYKISDRVQIKQEHQGYVLSCVTPEFFDNQKSRVSKSYQNQSTDSIVSNIVSEFKLGSVDSKDSDQNQYSLIVPNMSPFGAISWLSRFTKNPKGGADFWFYQVDDGKYNYKSLETMLSDRSGVKFKQLNPNKLDSSGNIPDDHFNNIESYEFINQHDAMANISAGYYGNSVITHNIYDKTIGSSTFSYGDDIPADKSNAPFDTEVFGGSESSHIVFQPVSTNGMGEGIQLPADTHSEWLGSRKTNVMKLEENRLVMTVSGSVAHSKLLGKQVDIELPSHQDVDGDQYLDKYMKGSYVVTVIRHVITPEFYKCVIELGKKRLETSY